MDDEPEVAAPARTNRRRAVRIALVAGAIGVAWLVAPRSVELVASPTADCWARTDDVIPGTAKVATCGGAHGSVVVTEDEHLAPAPEDEDRLFAGGHVLIRRNLLLAYTYEYVTPSGRVVPLTPTASQPRVSGCWQAHPAPDELCY